MHRLGTAILAILLILHLAPAHAQDRQLATVTRIVDGDTIRVQTDVGATLTVHMGAA